MELGFIVLIAVLFFLLATLYSSVGHAGASGYLAAMVLVGVPVDIMRPVALTLNVVVASLTTTRFYRAGLLSWSDIWPFLVCSVPLAFVGGSIRLASEIYRPLLGVLLLVSAGYLIWRSVVDPNQFAQGESEPQKIPELGVGGAVGFLSGLTGIGGGVLLSPIVLVMRWVGVRRASAMATAFILANSTAGLAGNIVSLDRLPAAIPVWAVAVLIGGYFGSELGIRKLPPTYLVWLLAVVLFLAGIKFLCT